jgi:tryptophanyl-tRNA synthetase
VADNIQGKGRVLSGMRPTGKIHLGNYMGALHSWVKLQDEYDCYFCIVDWHALTTGYEDTSALRQNTLDVATDYLAAGLDPERCVIFVQSAVKAHAELFVLLGMITPLGWLERVPSYKEQQENLSHKDLGTYGFLGYPLLQAADILIYQADFVPVGQDQVAHVELTREVARRFNSHFAPQNPILIEPKALLTPSPKLPGTDGRKMSKSYGNTIQLTDSEAEIRAKLKTMVTDPARVRRKDPGDPDKCPVGDLHKVFSSEEKLSRVYEGCRTAGIGCIECKGWLADSIIAELAPIQERRRKYEQDESLVWDILAAGAERAAARAEETMAEIRAAMNLPQSASANSVTGFSE